MGKTYTCGICGEEFDNVWDYAAHVSECAKVLKEKEEAEKAQKRMEEINTALNRVKEAKRYFEDQLNQFKEKYPEEYNLNFGAKKKEATTDKFEKVKKEKYNPESVSVSYSKKNDEEPKIRARVNGKDIEPEELFSDPDCKYLAELLGIL